MFFYIHYGRYRIEVLVSEKDMIKPLVDDRKYRAVKLTNNLEVLMISDVSSSRCSASMSVGVGSFQDDEDILGLAHFTEHMIFLGSKSYPKPGEFEDHLSNHFGITNAFTEDEKTTFYFEIGCRGFQKSLVMFSRMFSEPLFDINYMSKEINAVNSENDKNLNQDPWKEHQLLKNLSNPSHPYNRFNTGNNKTLTNVDAETLNKRLNMFYNKYYTPSNMKLVILSNQNLESMQNTIAQFFSDIRLDTLQKDNIAKYGDIRTKVKAFTEKELGKIVWYQKISPTPSLDLVFILDEVLSAFQFKPMDYIIYLLKYSGEGSLIKYLKDKKYVTKIDTGIVASYKNFSEFAISLSLTEKGLQHVIPILDATFNYINLIKSQKISAQIYDEIHNITKTQFKFLEKSDKYGDYLASIANSMFDYSYREILYGDYLHSYFNETLIRNFMDNLIPENSLILIGSHKFPPENYLINSIFKNSKNETESFYKTKFIEAKLQQEMISILKHENLKTEYVFKIRPRNEYITEENNIVSCLDDENSGKESCTREMRINTPQLYLNETNFKVWYKLDRSFLVPRVNINFHLITPYLRTTPEDYLVLNIFHNYLKSNFESIFSDFKENGNDFIHTFNENGLVFTLTLFSDLTNKVIEKLFNNIFYPIIDEASFNNLYSMSIDEMKSFSESQPYVKSKQFFDKIVKYNVSGYMDILNFAHNTSHINSNITSKIPENKMEFKKFNEILKKVISSFNINSLLYGYLRDQDLDVVIEKIKYGLNQASQNSNKNNTISLSNTSPLADTLHLHKTITLPVILRVPNDLASEKNHVVQNYFQIGKRDYKKSLVMNLIEMVWGNMFYYYLRTQQQLGYIVSANKEFIDNYMYFVFIVQGNKKTPAEMNLEIDKILYRLREKITSLPDNKFKEVINSIKNELFKKDTNLRERSRRIWMEIFQNSLDFTRKDKLIENISKITKSDILETFDDIFIDKPQKLSIQLYAPGEKIEEESEEVYYLNANLHYKVTGNVNILDSLKSGNYNNDDNDD
jgi:insulysin